MKINIKDQQKVEEVLKKANCKCSERLATYNDVKVFAKQIEEGLTERGLPKSLWKGLYFYIQPGACKLPNAYYKKGFFPTATSFFLLRSGSNWFIANAFRESIKTKKIEMMGSFKEKQIKAIIKKSSIF